MRAMLSFLPRAHRVAGSEGSGHHGCGAGKVAVLPSSLPHAEKLRAGAIVFIVSMRTLSASEEPRTRSQDPTQELFLPCSGCSRPFLSFPLCYRSSKGALSKPPLPLSWGSLISSYLLVLFPVAVLSPIFTPAREVLSSTPP